jgi:hypothetical protein
MEESRLCYIYDISSDRDAQYSPAKWPESLYFSVMKLCAAHLSAHYGRDQPPSPAASQPPIDARRALFYGHTNGRP